MKLKKLVFINLLVLFSVSIIVVIGVLKFHTFNLFAQVEVEKLQERNHLIVRSILNEIERLQGTARDWAQFDDSYHFIQDLNQDYIDANLVPGVVDDLGVFGLLYLDLEFKTRYGMVPESDRPLFKLISDQIESERDRLLAPAADSGKSILLYSESADQFFGLSWSLLPILRKKSQLMVI